VGVKVAGQTVDQVAAVYLQGLPRQFNGLLCAAAGQAALFAHTTRRACHKGRDVTATVGSLAWDKSTISALEEIEKRLTTVQIIEKSGYSVDTPLGEAQIDARGTDIGLQGGFSSEGVTNAIGYSSRTQTAPNEPTPKRPDPVAPHSALTPKGYWVNYGTSFIMAVEFGDDGPKAKTILTYGETSNPDDPLFSEQTKMFANKEWKDVVRTAEQIKQNAISEPYTVTG